MSAPELETCWEPGSSQPLAWNGIGWHYDGNYGGCSDCVRRISPAAGTTWADGYTPTALSITFSSTEAWESYGDLRLNVEATSGHYAYQATMPDGIKPAGTHTITFDLTDANLTGSLEGITYLGLWLGYGDGAEHDRSFTITDVTFTPAVSCVPDTDAYVDACYWEEDYCEDEIACVTYDTSSLMAGLVFDRTVQDAPLTQTRVSVACAHIRRDNAAMYLVDPVTGEILQWDADAINRLPFEWKSKTFVMAKPVNFGFAQVILDDISNTLAADILATLEDNAALWGMPCSTGAFGDVGVDEYMVGGSCILPAPTLDPEYTTLYVYADGTLRAAINVLSERLYRLPAGFKASRWTVEVAGNKGVRRITLSTSAAEIAQQ